MKSAKQLTKIRMLSVLKKEPSHSYQQYWLELRKDSNTLQEYGFNNRTQMPTKVKLQNKPALRPGEYLCKLKYQEKDQWKLFYPTPVTINSKWTYDHLLFMVTGVG